MSDEVCPIADNELRLAYASWLQEVPWDYFLTITFTVPRHPGQAIAVLQEIAGVVGRPQPGFSRLFLGTELHSNRTLHAHGLYRGPEANGGVRHIASSTVLWQSLFHSFGRSAVSRVSSNEDVTQYVTKYVTKALTEYNIW